MKYKEDKNTNSRFNILKEKIIQKLSSFKKKTINLIQTNYELGIFHLYKYNITDAIFRLKLVLFFNKNHTLAQYYLATCFYIKTDSEKAKEILEKLLSKDTNFKLAKYLLQFFDDLSIPEQCDHKIIKEFFNALIDEEYDFTDMIPAHKSVTTLITNHLIDRDKKLNILDIGCGSGQCFRFLKDSININKSIGVDFSETAIASVKKQKLYTQIICQDFQSAANDIREKFDVIVVDSVMHYYKDLSKQLNILKSLLSKNGLLIFTLEQSPKNIPITFNHILHNLCYNKEYVNKGIASSNLKLLQIESCKLQNRTLYICLCTNNS